MREERMDDARRSKESMLDLNKMHVNEKNFLMFRKKHLFVEMHELSNSEWHETHRWNYGLEEDMKLGEWTPAHLPTISVFGMMAFRDCLRPELVILDVATNEEGDSCRKLRQIAMEIVNHLVRDGQIEPGDASAALENLAAHLSLKKCVDHDAMKEEERDRVSSATAPAQSAMPRKPKRSLGSLEDAAMAEVAEEEGEDEASKTPVPRMNSLRRRRSSLKKMMSAHKMFHHGPTQHHSQSGTVGGIPEHLQPEPFVEDSLRPDAEEEALHVLIDNDFKELKSDAVVVVRLRVPIASEFEERFGEEKEQDKQNQPDLLARFIVLVLGPAKIAGSTEEVQQLFRRRHTEMGAAAAALMQDDVVVRSLYESQSSSELLDAIDLRLSAMRIMPHTSRPTKKAVLSRASRMYQQLAELRRVAEEQARQRLKESQEKHEIASRLTPEVVEIQNTGGKFLRLEYPDQGAKWGAREKDTFTYGLSVGAVFTFAQKYALPLLTGIVLALVLANTNPSGYTRWTGVAHDDDEDDHHEDGGDHRYLLSRMLSGSSHDSNIPTIFGLSINDHDFTLHFLVNDILMVFFFGLAVKEIAEAFQPGGSLYPPSKKAINPLLGTLGGVIGPVAVYFALLGICTSTGVLSGASFSTFAQGWGIPTATDISVAWVTAVVVFGSGHPAINFLLLCAVIDDGIGLVIIAAAYSDPDHPVQPIYLLLVVLAMLISYGLRKMECARWQVYVVLAGPVAWFGLIFANIHASLALCFVVPFMPIKIENEAPPSPTDFVDLEMQKEVAHHCSPLHEFEESVKNFVDFVVLFLFGLVNAGVDLDEYGGFSLVIVGALFIGKTLGMTVGSALAQYLGYGRPEGMSLRHLVIAGMISSVGLTVSLFIAGEAFPNDPLYEDQAKLGALLSVFPSLFFVALVNISPAGRKLLLGPPPKPMANTQVDNKRIEDMAPPGDLPSVAAGLSGDGISASPGKKQQDDEINYDADYEEPEEGDEYLEDVVVKNIQKTLTEIHRIEKQVESRAGVRRSSMMLNLVHDSCIAFSPTAQEQGPL